MDLHRILVIKPDHIGDLLIASQGFELLRRFFPSAHIDLVCGPWNVKLARKLGVFDCVHGIDIFHENSDEQGNPEVARSAKRKGVAALEKLRLGYYDLAIDMRYDRDSRSVLPSVDARIYAGYGTAGEYPFLDVVVPIHETRAGDELPIQAALSGAAFHIGGASVHGQARPAAVIAARNPFVELHFAIKGARSPSDCGTMPGDKRLLGVALEGAALIPQNHDGTPASPSSQSTREADVRFLSGWDNPESWGTWALGAHAHLAVMVPTDVTAPQLCVTLALRAHVNPANPVVECTVSTRADDDGERVQFVYPGANAVLSLVVPRESSTVKLVSDPIRLAPGTYKGVLRMYVPEDVSEKMALEVCVRGIDIGTTLLQRKMTSPLLRRGVFDLPLEFVNDLADERLVVSVETENAREFEGSTIEFLSLYCVDRAKPNTPVAHMEQWASLLVLRVAQMFSREPPFESNQVLDSLAVGTLPGAVENPGRATQLISRVLDWQHSGNCVVAIAMGCNSAIRTWPREYYIELARGLLTLGPAKIAFIGSAADCPDAEAACAALGLEAAEHSFCGAVPLDELGAVLQAFDLFLGNNSGTTHYAGKVGVRTFGIYSGTNHPREWGPVGPNASWIYRNEPCAPCFLTDLRACKNGHACLRNLLPSDVLAVVAPELDATWARRSRLEPSPPRLRPIQGNGVAYVSTPVLEQPSAAKPPEG